MTIKTSMIERHLETLSFSFDNGIRPSHLKNIIKGRTQFNSWLLELKRVKNKKGLSKSNICKLREDRFEAFFEESTYFDIKVLSIFDEINDSVDVEYGKKVYLNIQKQSGTLEIKYTASKTPLSMSVSKNKKGKSILSSEIVLSECINTVVERLIRNKAGIKEQDKALFSKYEQANFELSINERKIKKVMIDKMGKLFIFEEMRGEIEENWIDAVRKYAKSRRSLNTKLFNMIESVSLKQTEIGAENNLSRERIRQLVSNIFNIFEENIIKNVVGEIDLVNDIYDEIEEEIEDLTKPSFDLFINEFANDLINENVVNKAIKDAVKKALKKEVKKELMKKNSLNKEINKESDVETEKTEMFLDVLKFSLKHNLETYHFKNVKLDEMFYPDWLNMVKEKLKNGEMEEFENRTLINHLKFVSKSSVECDLYMLRMYNKYNMNPELHLDKDVFLKISKEKDSKDVKYSVVMKKNKDKVVKLSKSVPFNEKNFVSYENINELIIRIEENKDKLKGFDLMFFEEMYNQFEFCE